MKWTRILAAFAAMLISTSWAQAQTVKIGVITDLTGSFSANGIAMRNGIEAYIAANGNSVTTAAGKTINVEFLFRDTASQGADKAKQLAEELILRDGVKMFTGFFLTPHANAVAKTADEAQIPMVILNSGSANLAASEYMVRIGVTLPQIAWCAGDWASRNGVKKVVMIVADYAIGYDAEKFFGKAFTAGGGTVVESIRVPLQELNYAVPMERILQAKPDAVFMSVATGAPAVALVKAYVERGLKSAGVKLIGTGETAEDLLPNYTDDVIGAFSSLNYTESNTNPANAKMRAEISKKFGDKAVNTYLTAAGWDGADLIFKSLKALGADAKGAQYVDYFKTATFESPRGRVRIDPATRDVEQDISIRVVEKQGGKLVNKDIGKCELLSNTKVMQ